MIFISIWPWISIRCWSLCCSLSCQVAKVYDFRGSGLLLLLFSIDLVNFNEVCSLSKSFLESRFERNHILSFEHWGQSLIFSKALMHFGPRLQRWQGWGPCLHARITPVTFGGNQQKIRMKYYWVFARCLKITFSCSPELFNLLKTTFCTTLLLFYCPRVEKYTRWQWVTSFFGPAKYSFFWIQRKLH